MNKIDALIDPRESLERQNEKLFKIVSSLMNRVEQSTDASGAAYALFQRAATLEDEVRARTRDLEHALELLNESNAQLGEANRQTEAARADLANAIETIQEGFALFDPSERLVLCNSRFGMHMPDVRAHLDPGLSFTEYVRLISESQFLSLPDGETRAQWAARRMERHRDDHVIFNVRMIWSRWVQVSEHRTPDGGTVILQTDVTDIMRLERQERERMLDDQARLIRATLDHLDQGVLIFDSRARVVGWNARAGELLSIPMHRFHIGTSFETLFERFRSEVSMSDGLSADAIETWVSQRQGRQPLSFEISRASTRVLAVFAQEMPDRGFVISFTDVTAERAAVQALTEAKETLEQRVLERTIALQDALKDAERANASKSRFVAAASHDLLQPLSAAKLYVASVESDASDANAKAVLGKAGRALQSVENILEALLDISKLDSGRASVHIAPVPLERLLGQLYDEMLPLAVQKGLQLRLVPSASTVNSDATYLRRILQNLLANAIRYTDKGRVLLGARRVPEGLRLEVWDTGPGIPVEHQELIFREFQRLHAAASAAEGMGLGLAIVERACALLDHPLAMYSQLGRGTVFSVTVPVVALSEKGEATDSILFRSRNRNLQGLIVLLIENDADLRHALSVTIEKWGADVIATASGREAIDLIEEIAVAPDVILADYQLEDGELGTDAVAHLFTTIGSCPTAIITANRDPEVAAAATSLGAQLMHKPLEPEKLRNFLTGAFARVAAARTAGRPLTL